MAARDCIQAIREAAGEGVVSKEEAQALYTRANNLALARAKAKSIPLDEAFTEIAGELKGEERNKAALAKRNAALNVYKSLSMRENAIAHKSGSYSKGFRQVLESINLGIKDLSDRFHSGFDATVEKLGGKDALKAVQKERFNENAVWEAVDAMQRETTPQTKDKIGLAIASAYENFRNEAVPRTNRNGGDVRTGPGYLFSRSWSRVALIDLGKENGVFNFEKGRNAFRAAMEADNIKVDWERTYNGEDKEKFWNAFYKNLINDEHANPSADLDKIPGVLQGSVAKRASRPRELWFQDWQSEKAIHDQFSNRSTMGTIYGMMHNTARNVSLMQVAGPDAINNLSKTHKALHILASDLGNNGPAQTKALESGMFDTMVKMLSGQSAERQGGTFESIMRGLRSLTNLRYSGDFLVTNMPDLAFLHHRMTQLGLAQMDIAGMARDAYLGGLAGADKKALWSAQFVAHDSVARHLTSTDGYSWAGDKLDRLNRLTNQISGYNHHNLALERASADGLAHLWASESHLPYDKLSEPLRKMFEQEPDFTPAHWDVFRKSTWSFADADRKTWAKDFGVSDEVMADTSPTGKEKHLTIDGVDRLPSEAFRPIMEGRFNDTPANVQRVRDELSSMLGRMKENFTDKALNRPDLRTRYWLGQGVTPGTPARVLVDTLTMYKSFITQTTSNVFDEVTQGNGWSGLSQYLRSYEGIKSTARLIAMTTIAGFGVLTTKDYLQGRTRRRLLDDNGVPNYNVLLASMARGGGLGIMSNFLFDEYDKNMRTFSGSIIGGPVVGQLDPLFTAFTDLKKAGLEGDEQAQRDIKTGLVSAYSNRLPIPYLNLWYTRPFLNYMVMWNIRDMLSPGIMQRQEQRVGQQGYQSFWLSPSRAAAIPIDEPGRKMELLLDSLSN